MTTYYANFKFTNDLTKIEVDFNGLFSAYSVTRGSLSAELVRFITECDLYRIHTSKGVFYIQQGIGGILELIKDSIIKKHLEAKLKNMVFGDGSKGKEIYRDFYNMFDTMERIKRGVSYDFEDDGVSMNLFNQNDFQKGWTTVSQYDPYERLVHPLFDILMKSLSGNNENFQSHVERCVLRKRFYPHDINIPAIVITDPGGTGKQLFVMKVLKTIFNNSVVLTDTNVLRTKGGNIRLLGKAIVYIDELTNFTQDTYKLLKRYIANEYVAVRALYGDEFNARNVAWTFISGNSDKPILPVTTDGAHRRFSVIVNGYDELRSKNIAYYIEKSEAYAVYKKATGKSADQYLNDNVHVLSDKEQCEVWLSYILYKQGYPLQKERIHAYRDNEIVEDLIDNLNPFNLALDLVMIGGEFTSFTRTMFKNFYNEVLRLEPKETNDISIGSRIRAYMKSRGLDKTWKSIRQENGDRYFKSPDFSSHPSWILSEKVPEAKIERARNTVFEKYKEAMILPVDKLDVFHFTQNDIIEEVVGEIGQDSWNNLSSEERQEQIDRILEEYQAGVPILIPKNLDHDIIPEIIVETNDQGETCYRFC